MEQSSTSTPIPRILVCGNTASGKKSLVKGILQLDHYLSTNPVPSPSTDTYNPPTIEFQTTTIPNYKVTTTSNTVPKSTTATQENTTETNSDTSSTTKTEDTNTSVNIYSIPWNISTKYYTANIEWYILPSDEFLQPTDITQQLFSSNQQEKNPIEALLLIIDPSTLPDNKEENTNTLTSLLANWLTIVNDYSPPCLLLLSNKIDILTKKIPGVENNNHDNIVSINKQVSYGSMDSTNLSSSSLSSSSSSSTENLSSSTNPNETIIINETNETNDPNLLKKYREYTTFIQDWCLDNGFEHIETVATSPLVGAYARDKVNIPRLLEALQSNMWSNMERKKTSTSMYGGMSSLLNTSSTIPSANTNKNTNLDTTEIDIQHKSNEPTDSTVTNGSSSSRNIFEVMRNAVESGEASKQEEVNDHIEDDEEEEDVDIGALMEEMQRIRNQAQTGTLSDEARREAAARMVMKLYSVLGGGDDDEE